MGSGRLEFLKTVDILDTLSSEDLSAIDAIAQERSCDPEDEIFLEGSPSNSILIVREGVVRCMRGGSEITVICSGEAFGVTSYLDRGTRNVDAIAEGRVKLLVLERASLDPLLQSRPEIARGLESVTRKHLRSVLDLAAVHRGTMA